MITICKEVAPIDTRVLGRVSIVAFRMLALGGDVGVSAELQVVGRNLKTSKQFTITIMVIISFYPVSENCMHSCCICYFVTLLCKIMNISP